MNKNVRKTILLIKVVRENVSQGQNYDNSCKSYQPPLKSGMHGMICFSLRKKMTVNWDIAVCQTNP